MSSVAEVGGLNERDAQNSFRAALDGLQECISAGAQRQPMVGGSIEFAVKVDAQGRAQRVWAPQSSLGERATEKCMFNALRRVSWPAPVGGTVGIARNSFEFDRLPNVRSPGVWDAARVAPVLEQVGESLAACRAGSPGKLLITLYIGDGGRALSGGAAADETLDEGAVDCVVDALLAADYPPPEHSPTQVRFRLD
jgi:hypothetical protein